MSLDLAWDKLDSGLAQRLVDILNKSLTTAQRPSFIGPLEITGFDFGTVPPDVEVVDLRDIYRDFLEDDDAEEGSERKRKAKGKNEVEKVKGDVELDEEGYEWVSRRDPDLAAAAYESASYHPLPPHMRYNGVASVPNLADFRPGLGLHARGMGMSASLYSAPPAPAPPPPTANGISLDASLGDKLAQTPRPMSTLPMQDPSSSLSSMVSSSSSSNPTPTSTPSPTGSTHPNIQIHLRILHHSDLRLSLTTSLLINYPSPLFLSLPIKLAVTGLEFNGEVALAYEGASSPRRVHFCILDDLDPYGLATTTGESPSRDGGIDPAAKPLPVGQRLLPSIFIESEIGQQDKHVLRNVTRVERFIQDVIRKTVEDELVFPNFHTIVLGE